MIDIVKNKKEEGEKMTYNIEHYNDITIYHLIMFIVLIDDGDYYINHIYSFVRERWGRMKNFLQGYYVKKIARELQKISRGTYYI